MRRHQHIIPRMENRASSADPEGLSPAECGATAPLTCLGGGMTVGQLTDATCGERILRFPSMLVNSWIFILESVYDVSE